MGRAAPCAMRHPGFSAGFPGGGSCGIPEPAQARRKPVCGRGAGAGAAQEREGGSLAAAAAPRLGMRRPEGPPAAAPPASGVGCYAMDSANEPSLLIWCLSRALPALTTIMSMPSKRTGTSPSGV